MSAARTDFMPIRSALITVMERAARKAAPNLRRDFNEVDMLQVSRKGPADFVSRADQRTEDTLVEELKKARPGWGFKLEEGGLIDGEPGMPRWIIDPLDGTTNFLHGLPHFAISIAAEEAGQITAALIYQPLTDESFWAEKGKGAWLGERRLRVSARENMRDAVIATGVPYLGHGDHALFSTVLNSLMPEIAGIRRFGAASLDLAYVAAGRFDGFWEEGLESWDMAAGVLLVREAGGFVTDFRGGDKMLDNGTIIAANPSIHSRLHKHVAQAMRKPKAG
jgi:myo-inositol-1(or 4)-monophosphatase